MSGPNVSKLIAHKMSREAIPPSGSVVDGIHFLLNRQRLGSVARESVLWVREAIAAVRQAADPNPWRDADDETIAGEILRQLEARKKEPRR